MIDREPVRESCQRLSFRSSALLALWLCFSSLANGQETAGLTNPPPEETFALPPSVPDPIEPFNRVMWSFNKGVMTGVVRPTSRVYRFVIRKPMRTGIANFGRNLTYPGRLINNLLEANWQGARDESARFVWNTTVGVGGIFDVADKQQIPRSDADFGQTFGTWGWEPQCFIMLPFFGPSNERDTLGLATDITANPLIYIDPYKPVKELPPTYQNFYTYFAYGERYNGLSDTVGEYVRFSQAEMDPYAEIQYAWTFARENRVANFRVKGKRDEASLETLESVFFSYKDPEFPFYGRTRSALIPTTCRKLKFTFWLQPGKAPVVYIVPGLGSHRLAGPSMALAELVFKHGFSAVCVSSPFNSEFMENASTAALPAYVPVDAHDLHVALTQIDHRLNGMYPGRLGEKALMGYSMGALHALAIAASNPTNQLIKFDRYVAISPPVRLEYGISKLDEFYQAPMSWPAEQRTDNIENTFLKVADLSKTTITPQTSLPFSEIESKFLIGVTYRFILRDIIFTSQRRNNQGILREPIRNLRRAPVYQEILQYSYRDYFEKFVVPYYKAQGLPPPPEETLKKAGDLRTYDAGLRADPNIRVIVNQNDFLLTEEDLAWLRSTFPPQQLTVFVKGGHLGNLVNPAVQNAILGSLAGLKPSPPAK